MRNIDLNGSDILMSNAKMMSKLIYIYTNGEYNMSDFLKDIIKETGNEYETGNTCK